MDFEWDSWRQELLRLMADPATEVYWELDDIVVRDAIQSAVVHEESGSLGGSTNWELLQFCRNPEWRLRSRFFRNGVEKPDPFETIGWCDDDHQ